MPLTPSQTSTLKEAVRVARDGFAFLGSAAMLAQAVADLDMTDANTLSSEDLASLLPDAQPTDLATIVGFILTMQNAIDANNGAARKAVRRLAGHADQVLGR